MPKDNWKEGLEDILYYRSGDLKPWPAAACAACNYGLRAMISKIITDDQKKRYIERHK